MVWLGGWLKLFKPAGLALQKCFELVFIDLFGAEFFGLSDFAGAGIVTDDEVGRVFGDGRLSFAAERLDALLGLLATAGTEGTRNDKGAASQFTFNTLKLGG